MIGPLPHGPNAGTICGDASPLGETRCELARGHTGPHEGRFGTVVPERTSWDNSASSSAGSQEPAPGDDARAYAALMRAQEPAPDARQEAFLAGYQWGGQAGEVGGLGPLWAFETWRSRQESASTSKPSPNLPVPACGCPLNARPCVCRDEDLAGEGIASGSRPPAKDSALRSDAPSLAEGYGRFADEDARIAEGESAPAERDEPPVKPIAFSLDPDERLHLASERVWEAAADAWESAGLDIEDATFDLICEAIKGQATFELRSELQRVQAELDEAHEVLNEWKHEALSIADYRDGERMRVQAELDKAREALKEIAQGHIDWRNVSKDQWIVLTRGRAAAALVSGGSTERGNDG